MHTNACAMELLLSSDVSRLACGDVTPATVRGDAARGRIAIAAVTPRGHRLFTREAAVVYLAARAQRQR